MMGLSQPHSGDERRDVEFTSGANDYHIITRWRVEGTVEEVYDVLGNVTDLARWWPSVYLDAREVEPGDENGIGKVISLYTKGWLPYTLRWQFRVTEARRPHGSSLIALGDFVGRGIWTFEQAGRWVDATYDWKIRVDKSILRQMSFLFKPIFSANHNWAMARGEESLWIELARRRAASADERALVPAPPGPTPTETDLLRWGAPLAVGAGLIYLVSRKLSRRGA